MFILGGRDLKGTSSNPKVWKPVNIEEVLVLDSLFKIDYHFSNL